MMKTRIQVPLLMTASVSTRGMKNACFSDYERETMYIQSLSYYCRLFEGEDVKIVFVDNSGWDLGSIKRAVAKDHIIEYISLSPELFDISKGKGYNELLLINKAIEQSSFIKESRCFFKVTGRYPIYNIDFFLREATRYIVDGGIAFYGDMKDHKLYDWLHPSWSGHSGETRLYASTTSFYEQYIGSRYKELNDYDGHLAEGLLYDVMKPTNNIIKRFRREPHFGGIEGSNVNSSAFTKEQDSLKGKIKRMGGNLIRTFFPSFWF